MVSYGSCQDSMPTLKQLILNDLIQEIIILENKKENFQDWSIGNTNIQLDHEVLTHEKLTVYNSDENIGFGPGMRKLFAITKTRYALIINPDCILTKNGFEDLYKHISDCNCAVTSGSLVRPDNHIDAKNPYLNFLNSKSVMEASKEHKNFFKFSYFTGALALFDVPKLIEAGNYSDFFMYFDEIDTTLKLHRSGYEAHFIDAVVGIHLRGLTTLDGGPNKSIFTAYWASNSAIRFTRKHKPMLLPYVFFFRFLWAVKLFLSGQKMSSVSVLSALRDATFKDK